MFVPVYSKQFEKDVKKISKSGSKNILKLKKVIEQLISEAELNQKYKNHRLFSNWKNHFECHIEPDWLLIYKIDKDSNEIYFARTGSHSELFD